MRITTLGSVRLEQADGGPLKDMPRRAWALLVRLAVARGEPVSRDHLCALLWEERVPSRGRHRLSDSLSVLRRATGDGALETHADQVRLAPAAVWCDAVALQEAVEQERWSEAAALWQGGFLEGFFFRGVPGFEQWAEDERSRLDRLGRRALEAHAGELEAAGSSQEALAAWARLAALQPLDSRTALQFVQAIARSGDLAGALKQADVHAALLRAELGVDADDAFRAGVATLRAPAPVSRGDVPSRTSGQPRAAGGAPAGLSGGAPASSTPPGTPAGDVEPGGSAAAAEVPVTPSPARRPAAVMAAAVTVLALGVLVGLGAGWFRGSPGARPEQAAAGRAAVVAVLPFENLSPEPANSFFAAGMHEEILTQLTAVPGLDVISRASVLQYRDARDRLPDIAAALGADLVLQGSVQRADGRVRITAQLIDAGRDVHLWAGRYDRDLDDIFAIQTDVARQVARIIRGTLATPAAVERPTRNHEAYDHYLRGLLHLRQGFDEDSHRGAVASFRRAVQLDTAFALGWSQLSLAEGRLHWFMHEPGPGSAERARRAAERSLALAPDLPEASRAMGDVLYRERRYLESVPYLEAAYRDRAGDASLAAALAAAYRRIGRWDESNRLWERAMELDPLSGIWPLELGSSLMSLGRYAEADRLLENSIALSPGQGFWPYWSRARLQLLWRADAAAARRVLDAAPDHFQRQLADLRLIVDAADGPAQLEAGLERLRTLPAEVADRTLFVSPRELLEADYLRFLGRSADARSHYQAARARLATLVAERPEDYGLHLRLGRAAAAMGDRPQALASARRANELFFNVGEDAYWGGLVLMEEAYIRTTLGDHTEASALVEKVLAAPSFFSPRWVAVDPHLRNLRTAANATR